MLLVCDDDGWMDCDGQNSIKCGFHSRPCCSDTCENAGNLPSCLCLNVTTRSHGTWDELSICEFPQDSLTFTPNWLTMEKCESAVLSVWTATCHFEQFLTVHFLSHQSSKNCCFAFVKFLTWFSPKTCAQRLWEFGRCLIVVVSECGAFLAALSSLDLQFICDHWVRTSISMWWKLKQPAATHFGLTWRKTASGTPKIEKLCCWKIVGNCVEIKACDWKEKNCNCVFPVLRLIQLLSVILVALSCLFVIKKPSHNQSEWFLTLSFENLAFAHVVGQAFEIWLSETGKTQCRLHQASNWPHWAENVIAFLSFLWGS